MGMPGQKFSWSRFFLISFIGLIAAMGFSGVMKWYFSFHSLNEDTNKLFFYTWKANYAQKSLMEKWSLIEPNDWDNQDKDLNEFILKAQGEKNEKDAVDSSWLYDFYPEHFSRFPQYKYYTYNFDWNVETFIPLRKHMIAKSMELDGTQDKVDKYFGDKKNESPPSLFWDLPEYDLKADSTLKANVKASVDATMTKLHGLLKHLSGITEDKDRILDNTDENNEIVNKTFELFQTMQVPHMFLKSGATERETMTKAHVLTFWRNLGAVRSTPYESFIYTRMFFLFYFHTTSMPRAQIEDPKTKQAREENPKELIVHRHKDFAKIMAKGFKNPTKFGTFQKLFLPKLVSEDEMKIEDQEVQQYLQMIQV